MMTLGRWARLRVFLRSFAVQGSWNYRGLIGTGFAFALLPALRQIYAGKPEELDDAVRRHSGLFNSHPYLAPVALGAVASMEAAGEDPALTERFKTAVRGSLGTLGDRLVWATWRPICLLLALAFVFAGAAWWVAPAAFLVVYNAGHIWLRAWGFVVGLREGKYVGERLRRSAIATVQRRSTVAGAFLVGFSIPLAATGGEFVVPVAWPWTVAAAAGAVLGIRRGASVRTPLVIALTAFTLFGCLMGIV